MSVQSSTSKVQYSGNASSTTPYPVPFLFLQNADLVVVVRDSNGVETTLGTGDYSVTGSGNPSGGSVTTAIAYNSTNKVTIYRQVAATQLTVYTENDTFPAASHEAALDKLTMLVQQVMRGMLNSLRVSESSQPPSPFTAENANQIVGFDSNGNVVSLPPSNLLADATDAMAIVFNRPTATWIDAPGRALNAPLFVGQIGVQQIDGTLWIAAGTMPGNWISYSILVANSVATAMIQDAAITAAKLAASSVTASAIASGAVGTPAIAAGAVNTSAILDQAVTRAKLASDAKRSYIKLSYTTSDPYPAVESLLANTWNVRALNTKDADPDSILGSTIGSTVILPSGTYEVEAFCPISIPYPGIGQNYFFQTRLWNATDAASLLESATLLYSTTLGVNILNSHNCILSGLVTLAAAKSIQIQHWVSQAAYGGSNPVAPGSKAVFSQLILRKVD